MSIATKPATYGKLFDRDGDLDWMENKIGQVLTTITGKLVYEFIYLFANNLIEWTQVINVYQ